MLGVEPHLTAVVNEILPMAKPPTSLETQTLVEETSHKLYGDAQPVYLQRVSARQLCNPDAVNPASFEGQLFLLVDAITKIATERFGLRNIGGYQIELAKLQKKAISMTNPAMYDAQKLEFFNKIKKHLEMLYSLLNTPDDLIPLREKIAVCSDWATQFSTACPPGMESYSVNCALRLQNRSKFIEKKLQEHRENIILRYVEDFIAKDPVYRHAQGMQIHFVKAAQCYAYLRNWYLPNHEELEQLAQHGDFKKFCRQNSGGNLLHSKATALFLLFDDAATSIQQEIGKYGLLDFFRKLELHFQAHYGYKEIVNMLVENTQLALEEKTFLPQLVWGKPESGTDFIQEEEMAWNSVRAIEGSKFQPPLYVYQIDNAVIFEGSLYGKYFKIEINNVDQSHLHSELIEYVQRESLQSGQTIDDRALLEKLIHYIKREFEKYPSVTLTMIELFSKTLTLENCPAQIEYPTEALDIESAEEPDGIQGYFSKLEDDWHLQAAVYGHLIKIKLTPESHQEVIALLEIKHKTAGQEEDIAKHFFNLWRKALRPEMLLTGKLTPALKNQLFTASVTVASEDYDEDTLLETAGPNIVIWKDTDGLWQVRGGLCGSLVKLTLKSEHDNNLINMLNEMLDAGESPSKEIIAQLKEQIICAWQKKVSAKEKGQIQAKQDEYHHHEIVDLLTCQIPVLESQNMQEWPEGFVLPVLDEQCAMTHYHFRKGAIDIALQEKLKEANITSAMHSEFTLEGIVDYALRQSIKAYITPLEDNMFNIVLFYAGRFYTFEEFINEDEFAEDTNCIPKQEKHKVLENLVATINQNFSHDKVDTLDVQALLCSTLALKKASDVAEKLGLPLSFKQKRILLNQLVDKLLFFSKKYDVLDSRAIIPYDKNFNKELRSLKETLMVPCDSFSDEEKSNTLIKSFILIFSVILNRNYGNQFRNDSDRELSKMLKKERNKLLDEMIRLAKDFLSGEEVVKLLGSRGPTGQRYYNELAASPFIKFVSLSGSEAHADINEKIFIEFYQRLPAQARAKLIKEQLINGKSFISYLWVNNKVSLWRYVLRDIDPGFPSLSDSLTQYDYFKETPRPADEFDEETRKMLKLSFFQSPESLMHQADEPNRTSCFFNRMLAKSGISDMSRCVNRDTIERFISYFDALTEEHKKELTILGIPLTSLISLWNKYTNSMNGSFYRTEKIYCLEKINEYWKTQVVTLSDDEFLKFLSTPADSNLGGEELNIFSILTNRAFVHSPVHGHVMLRIKSILSADEPSAKCDDYIMLLKKYFSDNATLLRDELRRDLGEKDYCTTQRSAMFFLEYLVFKQCDINLLTLSDKEFDDILSTLCASVYSMSIDVSERLLALYGQLSPHRKLQLEQKLDIYFTVSSSSGHEFERTETSFVQTRYLRAEGSKAKKIAIEPPMPFKILMFVSLKDLDFANRRTIIQELKHDSFEDFLKFSAALKGKLLATCESLADLRSAMEIFHGECTAFQMAEAFTNLTNPLEVLCYDELAKLFSINPENEMQVAALNHSLQTTLRTHLDSYQKARKERLLKFGNTSINAVNKIEVALAQLGMGQQLPNNQSLAELVQIILQDDFSNRRPAKLSSANQIKVGKGESALVYHLLQACTEAHAMASLVAPTDLRVTAPPPQVRVGSRVVVG